MKLNVTNIVLHIGTENLFNNEDLEVNSNVESYILIIR